MEPLRGEATIDNLPMNGHIDNHNGDQELLPIFLQDLVSKRKFSVHNEPPNSDWLLTKKNASGTEVGVATRGELVMIYGPPKSRKSTIMNCITASAYTDDDDATLGFSMKFNRNDTVLYFDTEMPITAFHRRQVKLNKMSGFGGVEDMENFHAYSLKPYSYRERLSQIEYFVKKHKDDVALIVIDQMADLVADINDRDSTAHLIEKLSFWADYSQAVIMGSIHVTKNSKDMTGVLGHELAKKMDSGFFLEKQQSTKLTKVTHLLSREEDVASFKFDHNEFGYPILIRPDDEDF